MGGHLRHWSKCRLGNLHPISQCLNSGFGSTFKSNFLLIHTLQVTDDGCRGWAIVNSWLLVPSGPVLAVRVIWRVNQKIGVSVSVSLSSLLSPLPALCLSNKQKLINFKRLVTHQIWMKEREQGIINGNCYIPTELQSFQVLLTELYFVAQ